MTPNPQQIGADRIVDAVGAYEIYGGPVLVIDFGTATTIYYIKLINELTLVKEFNNGGFNYAD